MQVACANVVDALTLFILPTPRLSNKVCFSLGVLFNEQRAQEQLRIQWFNRRNPTGIEAENHV
jgi:hypothetical protein